MASARIVRAREPAVEAGARLAHALAGVLRAEARVRLAIPGGSALAALAPARRALGADWMRVSLTWVDERCVPFADAESNRGTAYRSGALDPACPPQCELPLYRENETVEQAVRRAELALRYGFDGALDVLLLGLGADGHIAALFPGRPRPAGARVAFVPDSPKPPPRRITLTLDLLATARRAVLLATGESKRRALERLAAGDRALPASALRGLDIVTDLELDRGCA